jgi:MYXO-CTERM domain-containing protein
MVRHSAPQPLTYFGRFAILSANSPAAIGIQFAPVPPQAWTQLSFAITPTNPSFVTYEGSDFNTVFSQIGRVQFGINIPAALNGAATPFTFDVDKVSLVPTPEPAGALLAAMVGMLAALVRRRP